MLQLINATDVVHETLDEEVLVVQLKTGCYYTLADSAAWLWSGLTHSLSQTDLVSWLRQKYLVEPEQAAAAVDAFLQELAGEELIQPDPLQTPGALAEQEHSQLPFTAPRVNKHSDLEGLLLLDPVHEVNEEGWPHQQPPS